jgi:hypothetical protein
MNRLFFKLAKSGFLPLALLFVFAPVNAWCNPAETPYRLDKATAGLVGDVNAEICVTNDGISIEVQEIENRGGGGMLGSMLAAGINTARSLARINNANETIAPLREIVKDIDFLAAMQAALLPMLKELSFPRVIDLKTRDGAPLSRKKDILMKVGEGSFLDISFFYQFSPNAEALRMSTGFTLYLKGSAKGVVKGGCIYSSERIGKYEENDEAIALWAGNGGAAYRQVLNQGIEETVKLLNLGLINAGGKTVLGPDSRFKIIKIRTEYGEGSTDPKQEGYTVTGWIVEENEKRIIFQSGVGTFRSIPKSDIISQQDKQ